MSDRSSSLVFMTLASAVSSVLGWGYVVCWGVSLYPPLLLNKRLRSVEGVAIDTAYLNFLGCTCYFISVSMEYFSNIVRTEYALRHGGTSYPLINLNDVVYGAHSVILVSLLLAQFYFSGYSRSHTQRISRPVKVLTGIGIILAGCLIVHAWEINNTRRHYELVDVAVIFGTVKLFLSAIKYVPQAWYNYKRKSVKGFAIITPALDILGSVLSTLQLWLDARIAGDYGAIFKNPVKLLLALETTLFGIVFLVQSKLYSENMTVYNEKRIV